LLTLVEIFFGIYYTYIVVYAWDLGIYGVIPFLMLFQVGYLYTGLSSLVQGFKGANVFEPLARLLALARPRFSRSLD
jgi:hypothetical protein